MIYEIDNDLIWYDMIIRDKEMSINRWGNC
jgi:hypothetical protein